MEVEHPGVDPQLSGPLGCLQRVFAFAFGAPFMAGGLYMLLWSSRALHLLDAAMGVLCLLTGLVVIVPYGLGRMRLQKPLLVAWLVLLAGFLVAALVASSRGWA